LKELNGKLRKIARQLWAIQREVTRTTAKGKGGRLDTHALTELKLAIDNVRYLLWGHTRYSGSLRWGKFASGELESSSD
jgi:hypothetical protein